MEHGTPTKERGCFRFGDDSVRRMGSHCLDPCMCIWVFWFLFLGVFGLGLLALVDQAGLELTEIRLPLPPKWWD